MADAAGAAHAFNIKLGGIGAFPSVQSPRVIWIGLALGHEEAKSIVLRLEDEFEKCGLPKESRAFSSHITLGRVLSRKNTDQLKNIMLEIERSSAGSLQEFKTEKITLFKSTLTPKGPIYEVIQETSLKTA
jgi:2'-5' RNA ligase